MVNHVMNKTAEPQFQQVDNNTNGLYNREKNF